MHGHLPVPRRPGLCSRSLLKFHTSIAEQVNPVSSPPFCHLIPHDNKSYGRSARFVPPRNLEKALGPAKLLVWNVQTQRRHQTSRFFFVELPWEREFFLMPPAQTCGIRAQRHRLAPDGNVGGLPWMGGGARAALVPRVAPSKDLPI